MFRITGIIHRGFVRNIIISEAFLRDLLQADVGQVLKQAPTMKAYHNVPSPANPTRIASMIASGCAARIAIAGHGFAVIVVTTTFAPITVLFGQCEGELNPAACVASIGIIGWTIFGCDGGIF